MAKKAVIEIPVDDTAFKKFLELFQNYKDELAKLPENWKKADEVISGGAQKLTEAVRKTSAATDAHASSIRRTATEIDKAVGVQSRFRKEVSATDAAFRSLGKSAEGVGRRIASITKSVIGWGAAGMGLGAIGGMLGIDSLARSALVKQRGAMGMNASISEMQSFGVHMQQFAGLGTVQSVANAQIDPQQAAWLATLGLNGLATSNMHATDLTVAVERAIRRQLRTANPATMAAQPAYMAAQQLGFSAAEIRNIAQAPDEEFNRAVAGYGKDKNTLGFSPKVAQQWAELSMTLQRAGLVIDSALIRTLAPMAPKFEHMAKVVSRWIEQFSDSDVAKKWVKNLGSAFDELTAEIKALPANKWVQEIEFVIDSLYGFAKWVDAKFGIDAGKEVAGTYNSDGGLGEAIFGKKTGDPFNNPGNVRHKNIFGLWDKNTYPTDAAGLLAMDNLLAGKSYQNMTLRELIAKYNGHGLNSNIYAHFVSEKTGIPLDTNPDLSRSDTRAMIESAMIQFEGNGKRTQKQIQDELSRYQHPYGMGPRNYISQPARVTVYNHTAGRIGFSTNAAAQ